uniref:Uncharacterized protein n=1 Tax=Acinetobacter baumannii TaxID=470 RepID=A0A142G4K6_ACIBA|nr:hypothetical protein [Acinetobacter baumannii]ASS85528.1 hypothetical protein [Acinetobacter baumannii]
MPSIASVTWIQHAKREVAARSGVISNICCSFACAVPATSDHSALTITWQVPQAHSPPQSPSIPATPFSTANCISDLPASIATLVCAPSWAINVIWLMATTPIWLNFTVQAQDYALSAVL